MDKEKLQKTISLVTDLLAQERYEDLAGLCVEVRLSADEIQGAVTDYGRKILPLPPQGFEDLDIIAVTDTSPQKWSVLVPIFTVEEELSDLTLELTLIDSSGELYNVETDDLHLL